MTSQAEDLTLVVTYSNGTGVLRATADHPIISPLRLAIEQGKPPGKWTWLGVRAATTGLCKILGTFVFSVGGRLLFFPGGSAVLEEGRGDFDSLRVDHLTLDPPNSKGRYRSHIAVFAPKGKKSRGIGYSACPPKGHLLPWFSLLAPTLDEFETLPKRLEVTFRPPRPDVKGFAADLFSGTPIEMAPMPATDFRTTFFQLDIWAGLTRAWRDQRSRPIAWAYKPEIVAKAPAGSFGLAFSVLSICEVGQECDYAPVASPVSTNDYYHAARGICHAERDGA